MTIEVSEETFYKVFDKPIKIEVERNGVLEKHHYNCKEQRGVKIWNFASSKKHQYYLFDINY
ncbi:hypothetical protein Phi4:1_gp127 [Cellulophaga phage phi4:1]|uniref:Uncharacterized protein n=5 Tax=Lightbulbvirus TaxID=1918522 RepID=A0A0S2MWQ7_9CAUD|nr:hypothetical protein Phi4:1_gp127 [Cellulophaga phage phi4:1]YP_008241626.1 hypothetical protein Phi17:2_gp131 [Cellulophaga phage phi17:2]ALO80136.1 hypothetical protein Phi4113_127 [Cellulophaga phage phi4:1_13]ALO80333.1 hypothetical protein Phi4118_127 [Cellulophaga phage phi4:1_18]ALO80534.1 hypothetical protein Phi17218_131 [Cellulophaga phage phi17:2_18]AGO47664.1 hypothetical protein Phi17:2_gp131 [Cellulophaga phage phi17:2]AGO49540.1 hypothetical protein Phi4:1_gp127 [Cellulophag